MEQPGKGCLTSHDLAGTTWTAAYMRQVLLARYGMLQEDKGAVLCWQQGFGLASWNG